jgi:hypothetical protein
MKRLPVVEHLTPEEIDRRYPAAQATYLNNPIERSKLLEHILAAIWAVA